MGARVLIVDDSPTIRKLVGGILARHGYESVVAGDGQAALDRLREDQPIDLVLLDFVMPRMNGYQFCVALRADPELRECPVVLMSAKGDKIRDQFVQQTGAVDAVTKPFDARALVAVVESALKKAADGKATRPPAGFTEEAFSETTRQALAVISDPPPDRQSESSTPVDRGSDDLSFGARKTDRTRGSLLFAKGLAKIVAPALAQMSEVVAEQADIAEAIVRTLTSQDPAVLGDLARHLSSPPFPTGISGDLVTIPLPEILQVLQLQRQTGVCTVSNGKVEIAIVLREGLIDLARGKGASDEFRLGRFLVLEKILTRDKLSQTLRDLKGEKGPLGQVLRKRGLIREEDLRKGLARQTSELIYEVLRWPEGYFHFVREVASDDEDSARLGLPVASIVMEGFRRVDEWRLIEASIRFEEVLLRDQVSVDALGQGKLSSAEQALLEAVNGERTVREILAAVDLGSFEACKILYQFLQSRLVRRRAP